MKYQVHLDILIIILDWWWGGSCTGHGTLKMKSVWLLIIYIGRKESLHQDQRLVLVHDAGYNIDPLRLEPWLYGHEFSISVGFRDVQSTSCKSCYSYNTTTRWLEMRLICKTRVADCWNWDERLHKQYRCINFPSDAAVEHEWDTHMGWNCMNCKKWFSFIEDIWTNIWSHKCVLGK